MGEMTNALPITFGDGTLLGWLVELRRFVPTPASTWNVPTVNGWRVTAVVVPAGRGYGERGEGLNPREATNSAARKLLRVNDRRQLYIHRPR
jgi:hypothetical protein